MESTIEVRGVTKHAARRFAERYGVRFSESRSILGELAWEEVRYEFSKRGWRTYCQATYNNEVVEGVFSEKYVLVTILPKTLVNLDSEQKVNDVQG